MKKITWQVYATDLPKSKVNKTMRFYNSTTFTETETE